MSGFLTRAGLGLLGFVLLDGLWLGLVMSSFYKAQLAPIARMTGGQFTPNWAAALAVYALLGVGIAAFVPVQSGTTAAVAASGALLGLVVYGVYDLTNYATLRDWPFLLVVVDVAWGACATATCAILVRAATR